MRKIYPVVALAAISLTGCSTVNTPPDMIALHYSGGNYSNERFVECIPVSTRKRDIFNPGEKFYYFPTRAISYDATGGERSESKPFTIASKDNAEMSAPATVNLRLDTSCIPLNDDFTVYKGNKPDAEFKDGGPRWPGGKLQAFWETIGRKYNASVDRDDQKNPAKNSGWIEFLNYTVGKPLDTTYDRLAQAQLWRDLWNNPITRTTVEQELVEALPNKVNAQGLGEWLVIETVTLLRPTPTDSGLTDAIQAEQTGIANARAAEAKARADKLTADAQKALKQSEADGLAARIKVLGVDGYLKEKLVEKGINPYQPTYGGSTIVDGQK